MTVWAGGSVERLVSMIDEEMMIGWPVEVGGGVRGWGGRNRGGGGGFKGMGRRNGIWGFEVWRGGGGLGGFGGGVWGGCLVWCGGGGFVGGCNGFEVVVGGFWGLLGVFGVLGWVLGGLWDNVGGRGVCGGWCGGGGGRGGGGWGGVGLWKYGGNSCVRGWVLRRRKRIDFMGGGIVGYGVGYGVGGCIAISD
uniref:Uncharacterized protein n=1 Tax=Knipowitschia caucasica TaxID=637954 RepID=A0AAV2JSP3_KNICA